MSGPIFQLLPLAFFSLGAPAPSPSFGEPAYPAIYLYGDLTGMLVHASIPNGASFRAESGAG